MEKIFKFKPKQFLKGSVCKDLSTEQRFLVLRQIENDKIYGKSYELFDLTNWEKFIYPSIFADNRLVVDEKVRS